MKDNIHHLPIGSNPWYELLDFISIPDRIIYSESEVGDHVPSERSHLYHTLTHSGTEMESLLMLHTLILLFKPELVLETGTDIGLGTLAMASALAKNGFGKIVTVDNDRQKYETARVAIQSGGLSHYVQQELSDSLTYIRALPQGVRFGLVFFDSRSSLRIKEFEELWNKNALENLVVFHDTSRHRVETQAHKGIEVIQKYLEGLDMISREYCKGEIEMPYSRGLRIMQVKK